MPRKKTWKKSAAKRSQGKEAGQACTCTVTAEAIPVTEGSGLVKNSNVDLTEGSGLIKNSIVDYMTIDMTIDFTEGSGLIKNSNVDMTEGSGLIKNSNVDYEDAVLSNQMPNSHTSKPTNAKNETANISHCYETTRGHFHQGHARFLENSGRQCVANSLVALLLSKSKPLSSWTSLDLDNVLKLGNELYSSIQRFTSVHHRYLLVSELPHTVNVFDTDFTLTMSESLTGFVTAIMNQDIDFFVTLQQALQITMSQYDGCFVTFAESTFVVLKDTSLVEKFCTFDPHSRNADGYLSPDGTSVLLHMDTVEEVYKHCLNLAASMNLNLNAQFDVTGVHVTTDNYFASEISENVLDTEDIIVTETEAAKLLYCPLSTQQANQLCDQLGIVTCPVSFDEGTHQKIAAIEMGPPCQTKPIKGDGNCFFRALSYAISGTENNHRKIRIAVVKHLLENASLFQPHLRPDYITVENYITKSRMRYVGIWATEVEILATANMLQVDIWTFTGQWIRFSKNLANDAVTVPSIYLKLCNEVHYEAIDCVKISTTSSNQCCTNLHCESFHQSFKTDQNLAELSNSHKDKSNQTKKGRLNQYDEASVSKMIKELNTCKGQKDTEQNSASICKRLSMTEHDLCDTTKKKNARQRQLYHSNAEFRRKKILQSKSKYKKAEHKAAVKFRSIEKYEHDPEHKAAVKFRSIEKYEHEPEHKAAVKFRSIEKYEHDPEHKAAVKFRSIEKYEHDPEHKAAVKFRSIEKYEHDPEHKAAVKFRSIEKYEHDPEHKAAVKRRSIKKFSQDPQHREAVIKYNLRKYANEPEHKAALKQRSATKYANEPEHKATVKQRSTTKYANEPEHKAAVKRSSIKKYAQDPKHRETIRKANIKRKTENRNHRKNIDNVTAEFRREISKGPECVCSVCHRRLFQKQVLACKPSLYEHKGQNACRVAERCITDKFLHTCSELCDNRCAIASGAAGSLWICYTCHRKLLSGIMPSEAAINNLEPQTSPPELDCLNSLEQHLVALHIPFMKMLALPKGAQRGVHGPVVCVPCNLNKCTTTLPRCASDDKMVRVKLKRKLTYKGHYEYQFVSKAHIKNALKYLQANNKWYSDIQFDEDWINPLPIIEEENEVVEPSDECLPDLEESADIEDENEQEYGGMLMDTCLQPVDIAQEVLDQHFENITCVAPAEDNDPVKLLMDKGNEAKAFPVLFPCGSHTFHDEREEKITLGRYLHTRLMNADSRFARNVDYIFFAQYISELNQVISNVSIALRKGNTQACDKCISSDTLTNRESLREILKNDEGYKFLKPIRGTPPFWQSAQKDLFAMLRQLGIPTWFCSFSSAEMRWSEIVEAILQEEHDSRKAEDLDWYEKCAILRRNPMTSARMFDHRFRLFLKQVIKSAAEPIGKVVDSFYRVEFQQRGSPHTHCLFWVENAPKIDKDDDKTVTEFIDKYITCQLPSEDEDAELNNIVQSVQKHSKRHSKSCKKSGTTCRFNFPRPPSNQTFIARPADCSARKKQNINESETDDVTDQVCNNEVNDHVEEDKHHEDSKDQSLPKEADYLHMDDKISKEEAKSVLEKIWNALTNPEKEYDSVDALFLDVMISQELFEKASRRMTNKTSVVLKRQPSDVWVNQYNPDLLRCWNANMDIQYITDAYACVVYIISYISKSEREMSLLLDHAQKESQKDGNKDAKEALKSIGSQYLHNREVSAQEAIFRVCNLPMKECSRKVQFIPTGENRVRMSVPLSVIQSKSKSGVLEKEDMFMTSLEDRYKNRPYNPEMDSLCQASFASEYRILSKSEVANVDDTRRCNPVLELQNGLGFVQKRSRSDPAVIRYPRFSQTKEPEKYYRNMLELFLPYRTEVQLKPEQFASYQDFYDSGAVHIGKTLESVKAIVDRKRALFIKEGDDLDKAEELFETCGELEDAWAQICPETEVQRLECIQSKTDKSNDEEEKENNIPDLLQKDKNEPTEVYQSGLSKSDANVVLRSLNRKQTEVFYSVRQWCLDKSNNMNPEPFYLFLTGGAGTGKTHLVKAIQYEASRILARSAENPDDITVLLTAPTGVAAFNIGASTIHSTFSIGTTAKLPYQPLGDEKINTLRLKLASLQILIIDEISMVDHKLLSYIHGRLRQIKQTGDYSSFGKVSIIAVGDFYQLPPVKARPLYVEQGFVNLFTDNFKIAELTDIMRQKDAAFAQMLNRLRVRKKGNPLDAVDVNMLRGCETGIESDAIHIFATNNEVDMFNVTMLHSKCSDSISIKAQDFSRNPKTGKLEKRSGSHVNVFNTCLARMVNLALNARVMLTKNIDLADGLVNGVFGTLTHISCKSGEEFPIALFVLFDVEKVGQKVRKTQRSLSSIPELSTRIEPQEDRVNSSGDVRRQFPLKLAWACTTHKVQGLTVNESVVSLLKIFAAGQAYVALSRVSSLEGLTIQDFKESSIYCNENVETALTNMPQFLPNCTATLNIAEFQSATTIVMHNIEGLPVHIHDLRCDSRFLEASVICLTETWLSDDQPANEPRIEGFSFVHRPRSLSYNSSDKMFAQLKSQSHGGVGVYTKEKSFQSLDLKVTNLEYMAFFLSEQKISIAVVYRPQSYKLEVFKQNLLKMVKEIARYPGGTIIMGDFNDNALCSFSVQNVLEPFGFEQALSEPTTECGTLLDHVYIKNLENVKIDIVPTYYGYHEGIRVTILNS